MLLQGIDPSVEPPGTDLMSCKGEPYCEWVRANVLAFKDHPAISVRLQSSLSAASTGTGND